MRIGIIGSRGYPYVYSGYETFVGALAEGLRDRGHAVTVYAHRELFGKRPRRVNGVHVRYVLGAPSKTLSQMTHSALATLHAVAVRYDALLYVNSANGPFGVLTRLLRQPAAINVDGLEWLRPKWRGLGRRYFYWASRQAARWFEGVIADAERMSDVYEAEFGRRPVTIAYGADPGPPTDDSLLSKWSLQPGGYYLVVGRLIPDNNLNTIIAGFGKCRTTRRLVVVGDVPYSDSYADSLKATNDDRIVWCGYVRDRVTLDTLYASAYAHLHGHGFGGTNPTLLEAMACSAPVLAIDTPFNREVLGAGHTLPFWQNTSDGVLGALQLAERAPEALALAGTAATARISREYTWSRIVDEYERLFDDLVSGREALRPTAGARSTRPSADRLR